MGSDERVQAAIQEARARAAAREAAAVKQFQERTQLRGQLTEALSQEHIVISTMSIPNGPVLTKLANETDLARIVELLLPGVQQLISDTRKALEDRKLSLKEVLTLGPAIVGQISAIVSAATPFLNGSSARDVVLAVYGVAFDRWIAQHIPAMFRAPVKAMGAAALEGLYQLIVKKQKK